MLNRLKTSDWLVELNSSLRKLDGHFEHPLSTAYHLRAQRNRRVVEHALERGFDIVRSIEQPILRCSDVLKLDLVKPSRLIHRLERRHRQAFALPIEGK